MIGAFLGFIVGVVLSVTYIWPWTRSAPDVGGSVWDIILAVIIGIIAGGFFAWVAAFIIGAFLGFLAARKEDSVSFEVFFAIWGALTVIALFLGVALGGTPGRILVCVGPSIGLTAVTTILGYAINRPFSETIKARKRQVEKRKAEMIAMIDEALEEKGK